MKAAKKEVDIEAQRSNRRTGSSYAILIDVEEDGPGLHWKNITVEKAKPNRFLRFFICIWKVISFIWIVMKRCCGRQQEPAAAESPIIINGVSGNAIFGEMTALMGSSGAGKTTQMNVLAQRNLHGLVWSGLITLDGQRMDKSAMRSMSAYVQQVDLFEECLTVWQHLEDLANFRLGNDTNRKRTTRINDLLEEFELEHHKHTAIGKLSGGEKKRLAVASAILHYPKILFCDEPTSGLDADKAQKVVEILEKITKEYGMITIVTIHQPSQDVYNKFNKICVMGKGGIIRFLGTRRGANIFYKYNALENGNPAEWIIKEQARRDANTNLQQPVYIEPDTNAGCKRANGNLFFDILGSAETFLPRCMEFVGVAVFIGLTSCREEVNQKTVMNYNGRLYMAVSTMNYMFQFSPMTKLCSKLPIYSREYSDHLYGATTYFVAMNVADFLLYILPQCGFAAIFHVLTEPIWLWDEFAIFMAVCVTMGCVALSTAYLFACIFFCSTKATAVLPIVMIPLLSFSGFFLNSSTMHSWFFKACDWLSYFANAFEIMAVNKWRRVDHIPGCEYEFVNGIATPRHCYRDGKDVLDSLDFSENNLWFDWCLLLGVMIVCRVVAYIALLVNSRWEWHRLL